MIFFLNSYKINTEIQSDVIFSSTFRLFQFLICISLIIFIFLFAILFYFFLQRTCHNKNKIPSRVIKGGCLNSKNFNWCKVIKPELFVCVCDVVCIFFSIKWLWMFANIFLPHTLPVSLLTVYCFIFISCFGSQNIIKRERRFLIFLFF